MRIDHVELFVPRRREAADWYARTLGLRTLEEYAYWAEDPRGPLMISGDAGTTKIALFRGPAQGDRETVGFRRLAFRVDGAEFLAFLERGDPVGRGAAVDHEGAFSAYFSDPYGHALELTTYDHETVRAALAGAG